MSNLLFEVKPKYILEVRICDNFVGKFLTVLVLSSLFATVIALIYFTLIPSSRYLIDMLINGNPKAIIQIYILYTVLYILCMPIVFYIWVYFKKKIFEATVYKIYNNKINIEENFINHKNKIILFKDIKEIHLNQNFMQRKYNLGTLKFDIETSNILPNRYSLHNSIQLTDIENPHKIYNKVKKIHEQK